MSNVAGKIIPRPMGDYSATVTYSFLDMVTLDNKLYIARQSNLLGVSPTDTSKWALLIDGKTDVTALETTMNQKFTEVNDKVDNIQVGGRNLIRNSYIINSNCTTFTYDKATNTWDCVAAPGSNAFGYGFKISSGRNIIIPRGRTFIVSLEVKPDVDSKWWFDGNNSYSGNTTNSNDNDDMSKRKNSSRSLVAGRWTKVWFSYTAKEDVDYELFDSGTIWGIVTTDNEIDVHFQFRNVMGELATIPSEYTPALEDVDQQFAEVNTRIDNIQVGGRNLLLNSDFSQGRTNWDGANSTTIIVITSDDKTVLEIDSTTSTSTVRGLANYVLQNVELSTSYTLSGKVYVEQSATISVGAWYANNGWNSIKEFSVQVEPGWHNLHSTFTSDSVYDNLIVGFGVSKGLKALLYHPKLEKGTIATDWTPAPEDLSSVANTAATQAQEALDKAAALEAKLNSLTMTINTTTGNLEWRVDE